MAGPNDALVAALRLQQQPRSPASTQDALLDWLRQADPEGTVRGSVLPIKRGPDGSLSAAWPQMAIDAGIGAVELLGGTRTGDVTPKALELVANAAGGGAASAGLGGAAGRAGIFGGKLAKTADPEKLKQAEVLAELGADRKRIWDETGWFQGADGKWRFEIDDSGAQFTPPAQQAAMPNRWAMAKERFVEQTGEPALRLGNPRFEQETNEAFRWVDENLAASRANAPSNPMGDVLQHPDLYRAYPDAADVPTAKETLNTIGGSFDGKRITYGGGEMLGKAPPDSRSTLLHELQHVTQGKEEFARGGTPGTDDYRRLAGEVEARNVQARRDMTPEQRRATPPWETQDVPEVDQIVRMITGGTQMSAKPALPMDEASRMARAREMGYTVDAYHGTDRDFEAFDPNALKRTDDGWYGRGTYLTPWDEMGGDYAGTGPGARVLPLKAKLSNPFVYDVASIEAQKDTVARLKALGIKGGEHGKGGLGSTLMSRKEGEAVTEQLKRAGHDGVIVMSRDEAGNPVQHEYVVFDPKNIRSRFAAFDPAKRDSANLLAAQVGGVPMPGIDAETIEFLRQNGIDLDHPRSRKQDRLQ